MSLQQDEHDPVLREVAEAFDALEAPPMPGVEQTVAAIHAAARAHAPAPRPFILWSPLMKRVVPLSTAAVLLIAGVIAFFSVNTSSNTAYAAVRQQLETIETATFRVTFQYPDGESVQLRCMVKSPGLMRQEADAQGQVIVNVIDASQQQMLTLVQDVKIATRTSLASLTEEDTPVNVIDELLQIDDENAVLVGQEDLDGQAALLYAVKQGDYTGKIWVDALTLLPIRSELSAPSGDQGGQVAMIVNGFVWNPEIDDEQFSLDVPEGYRTWDLDTADAAANDVVQVLRIYAFADEGVFPDRFDVYSMYQAGQVMHPPGLDRDQMKARWTQIVRIISGIEQPTREQLKDYSVTISETISRAAIFLAVAQEERDYHWVGAGVQQGEPGRPVAHWVSEEGEGRTVIYADFTVRENVPDRELFTGE